jgi:alkyl hydroperoxide reductase subunit AhpF
MEQSDRIQNIEGQLAALQARIAVLESRPSVAPKPIRRVNSNLNRGLPSSHPLFSRALAVLKKSGKGSFSAQEIWAEIDKLS